MRKVLTSILLVAVFAMSSTVVFSQEETKACPIQKTKWQSYNEYSRWSVGANIGFPFFSGDFKSAASDKTYWGVATDLQVGYQITPTIGTRLSVGYAQNKAGARSSHLNYFITPDSYGFFGPNRPEGSFTYGELYSKIKMWAFNFNVDINVNNLFQLPQRNRRWTVLLSPGLYLQKFDPQLYTKECDAKYGNELFDPYTMGLGADAAIRFKASRSIDVQLRTGINWVHQKSFDGIAKTFGWHSHGVAYNFGAGIVWKINRSKHKDALMYAHKYVPTRRAAVCCPATKVSGRIIDTVIVKVVPEYPAQEKVVVVTPKSVGELPVVHFQRGSAVIDTQRYAKELDCMVEKLKEAKDVEVKIYGFADRTGTATINYPLSYNRAKALRDYLVANGIAPSRIKEVHGMGIDESLSGEDAYSSQARRAEVQE